MSSRVAWQWQTIYRTSNVAVIQMGSHPHYQTKRMKLDFGGGWETSRTVDSVDAAMDICKQMGELGVLTDVGFGRMDFRKAMAVFDKLQPRQKGNVNDAV
jgi:hypothetical protein